MVSRASPGAIAELERLRSHKAFARLTVVGPCAVRDPRLGRVVVRDVGNPGIQLGASSR